jgi:nickel-dependent lactate racemase
MSILAGKGDATIAISDQELREMIRTALAKLGRPFKKVLLVVPDFTRFNSYSGPIAEMVYEELTPEGTHVDVIPALGTHVPMTEHEIRTMYGRKIPLDRFIVHDWRNEVVSAGVVPGSLISEWSDGKVDYEVKGMINKVIYAGYDLILSIGQVVPHEVVGMANYTKNIMVGIGGSDMINKSHFLGAVCNMENIMGRADTPVRRLFNYAVETFLPELPISYMLTVRARNEGTGKMELRGFYCGGEKAFQAACKVAAASNLNFFDAPLKKVVVYLDPEEFKSTWLGNKAIYRTRMAIADDGELIVLAPALREFGEDKVIDKLIRKYGYHGTPQTLEAVRNEADLRENLGAAAHLIHGSSEGRFRITYCPGPNMPRREIEKVGFASGDLDAMLKKYPVDRLKDGFHTDENGEEFFYISNPALGLWACKEKFI